jgi:hypothetical protein
VLRWQVWFHKAFAPVVVSAYAVVVGIVGIACGFFADSIASHLRPANAEVPAAQERKASRVEIWLKSQAAIIEKPALILAELEDPISALPAEALQRPVRHAAEMAASLDGSETISIPSTGSVVALEAATLSGSNPTDNVRPAEATVVADIRESAESTTVDLARADSLTPVDASKSLESAPVAEGLKLLEVEGVLQPNETLKAASLKRVVKLKAAKRPVFLAAKKAKLFAGEKSKLAALKLRKMPAPVAVAKSFGPVRYGTTVIRARFADSPSEIIRRSLMGTG